MSLYRISRIVFFVLMIVSVACPPDVPIIEVERTIVAAPRASEPQI